MPQLKRNNRRSIEGQVFLAEGGMAPGATRQNWNRVAIARMDFDDPLLAGNPGFRRLAHLPSGLRVSTRRRDSRRLQHEDAAVAL